MFSRGMEMMIEKALLALAERVDLPSMFEEMIAHPKADEVLTFVRTLDARLIAIEDALDIKRPDPHHVGQLATLGPGSALSPVGDSGVVGSAHAATHSP